jgi:hypothetical protein
MPALFIDDQVTGFMSGAHGLSVEAVAAGQILRYKFVGSDDPLHKRMTHIGREVMKEIPSTPESHRAEIRPTFFPTGRSI